MRPPDAASAEDEDLVDRDLEHMREDHEVVDRGERVAAHPFEDGLRGVESADMLYICDSEAFGADQRADVRAGRGHVDHGDDCRHGKDHLSG